MKLRMARNVVWASKIIKISNLEIKSRFMIGKKKLNQCSFSFLMPSLRSEKIADELRKEISLIINKETKDPRLQNINITAVKVSDDIGIATVFYTIIGESVIKNQSSIDQKVLKKFSGMVRSKLSRTMQIRRVPVINFRFDESIEYSDNIENLLNNLK